MLNYNEFVETFSANIISHLPAEYSGYRVELTKVNKTNKVKDCLNVFPPTAQNKVNPFASPNIYLEDFFLEYKSGERLEELIENAARIIKASPFNFDISNFNFEPDKLKEQIVPILINKGKNSAYLQHRPYVDYLDMVFVFKILMNTSGNQFAAIPVDDRLMEQLQLNVQSIYKLALFNLRKILPPTLDTMDDIFKTQGINTLSLSPFYVISNIKKVHGATSIIFKDILTELACRFETDFYILPSSVHELLAIPVSYGTTKAFQDMVRSVNAECLDDEEWLSDNVYYYSCEDNALSIAT